MHINCRHQQNQRHRHAVCVVYITLILSYKANKLNAIILLNSNDRDARF